MSLATDIDWSIFAGEDGGDLFEKFCCDLLDAQGFNAERMAKGADEGKDILIYDRKKLSSADHPNVICIAECKSRVSNNKKAISLRDINRSLWALHEVPDLKCLHLYTTYKFNGQAINCFITINNLGKIKISWIDRDDLSIIAARHPSVWRRYFGTEPPQRPPHSDLFRMAPATTSVFRGDHDDVNVGFRILEPWQGKVSLEIDGKEVATETIERSGCYIFRIKSDALLGAMNPTSFKFVATGASHQANIGPLKLPLKGFERLTRLDNKFADPTQLCPDILQKLEKGCLCHITGGAGTGKSRLIHEVRRGLAGGGISIEYGAQGRQDLLFAKLVEMRLGMSLDTLSKLPANTVRHIGLILKVERTTLDILLNYCAALDGASPQDGFREVGRLEVAQAAASLIPDDVYLVALDNIQWMGGLDQAVFNMGLMGATKRRWLVASRVESASERHQVEGILGSIPGHQIEEYELDDRSTKARVTEFISMAAADGESAGLLRGLSLNKSFQWFMSTLKALRQMGALEISGAGDIRIPDKLPGGNFNDYAELQKLIVTSRLDEGMQRTCMETVAAGAVFGFRFPMDFIIEHVGDRALDALDQLERRELIKLEEHEGVYGAAYVFDHILTHAAVYGSISQTKTRRLHESTAEYILSYDDAMSPTQYYDAAYHKGKARKTREAINLWIKGANAYQLRNRVAEAQHGIREALQLFGHIPFDGKTQADVEQELRLRELFLDNALLVHPDEVEWERQISAFRIDTENHPEVEGYGRRSGRALCFQANLHGFRRQQLAAWDMMKRCLSRLERLEDKKSYADALRWALNIKKNLGDYDKAIQMGDVAYGIFKQDGDLRGMGNTAIEIYHTYAEKQDFSKALQWVHLARHDYTELNHLGLVARTHVEEARLNAIVQAPSPLVMECHDLAIELSSRHCIGSHVGRAMMNKGIYQAAVLSDMPGARASLEGAADELKRNPNNYQALMLDFSREILLGPVNESRLRDCALGERVLALCSGFDTVEHIGDRRILGMLKTMVCVGNRGCLTWLSTIGDHSLDAYHGIGLGEQFASLEKDTPLFSGWRCLLYY